MLSWGSNDHGQLGQGSVNATAVVGHQWAACPCPDRVAGVACGLRHTVAITVNGDVYSCGSNEKGQLGTESEQRSSFGEVLVGKPVQQASCGFEHTVAVTKKGQVFTWGDNRCGQLGRQLYGGRKKCESVPGPLDLKLPHPDGVCQVACGAHHTLALTRSCQVFSWGCNKHGQLGFDTDLSRETLPLRVQTLSRIPTVFVAAGGTHSFALSACGSVFAFGSNIEGQIGLPDRTGAHAPVLVSCLHHKQIRYIACGDSHTAALSESGEVFTFGNGSHGQLGHGDKENSDVPRMLKDIIASQIACGREHTLIMLRSSGKVLAFGKGIHGQLSAGNLNNALQPTYISGSWIVAEDENQQAEAGRFPGGSLSVHRVFAGGNHSFALVAGLNSLPVDFTAFVCPSLIARRTPSLPSCLTNGDDQGPLENFHNISVMLSAACDTCHPGSLIRILKTALMCPSCINGSFLESKKGLDRSDPGVNVVQAHRAFRLLCNAEILSGIPSGFEKLQMALVQALSSWLNQPQVWTVPKGGDFIALRNFLLLPEIPAMSDINHFDELLLPFVHALNQQSEENKETLVTWWSKLPTDHLQRRIDMLQKLAQNQVTQNQLAQSQLAQIQVAQSQLFQNQLAQMQLAQIQLAQIQFAQSQLAQSQVAQSQVVQSQLAQIQVAQNQLAENQVAQIQVTQSQLEQIQVVQNQLSQIQQIVVQDPVSCILNILHLLYDANLQSGEHISLESFYVESLSAGPALTFMDKFYCYPFALNVFAKGALLVRKPWFNPWLTGNQECPKLLIKVRRTDICNDALEQIKCFTDDEQLDWRKPLQVCFQDEPGLDWGGVTKEFFMLIFEELFSQEAGLFVRSDATSTLWFNEWAEDMEKFFLVGVLCGLAVCNNALVSGTFPLFLYCKLLECFQKQMGGAVSTVFCGYDRVIQRKPSLKDLSEIDPDLAQFLEQTVLSKDADVSDYGLTFEIDRRNGESIVTRELVPGGASKELTNENRFEYVEAYLDFIFRRSVQKQLNNFARGFLRACCANELRLFHPKELMEVAAGQTLDKYDVLEEIAVYDGGFSADHPVVRRFWAVFHRLTPELKRKFMIFLTGSDRVSVAVRETMKVRITPYLSGGADSLPVAHTCFNHLELPLYETENALERKLCYAIENAKGFHIV